MSAPAPEPSVALFRFYAELNDFLPMDRRGREAPYAFQGSPAVKDAIEAQGVPHPEVDLILADGISVGFDHRLRHAQRIAVYPVFEALDISPVLRLRERPLRRTRFVVDGHLGRLARGLRLLGFDTVWRRDFPDAEIIGQSLREGRLILTRDRGLLRIREVTRGYWVRATDPEAQMREVIGRFDLASQAAPFSRCTVCNGRIACATKEEVLERLPPRTRLRYEEFGACADCRRVYWKGPHYEALRALVARLLPLDEGK